jgi:regulator of protease activity HflC (stomatin/prohibitin superfamily)
MVSALVCDLRFRLAKERDKMELILPLLGVFVLFALPLLRAGVKIVQEYERGVIFRLGRVVGARGPGLFVIIPFIERMVKVDLRTITLDVPSQEAITRDNVTLRINAVVYFRVLEPVSSVINIENYMVATSQIAQTTLRNVIGQVELDELLAEREKINHDLQVIIDEATEPWGIKVSIVEVKDVELPEVMKRAMARQAEAERERRAKLIHAKGELEASEQLAAAAEIMGKNPSTLQLRYLQTLTEIAVEHNSTIVFPLPIDMLKAFMGSMVQSDSAGSESPKTQSLFERERRQK